jgi:cytosine permease
VAWLLGFAVGILPILNIYPVPAAPVAAFIVGAVVYFLCAKMGMQSQVIPMPGRVAEASKPATAGAR